MVLTLPAHRPIQDECMREGEFLARELRELSSVAIFHLQETKVIAEVGECCDMGNLRGWRAHACA